MAAQDRSGLASDLASDFADNASGDITEEIIRDFLTDVNDSNFNLTDDDTGDINAPIITGATRDKLALIKDAIDSVGWLSGGGITDDTDGTITVAAGTGTIRATDSDTAALLSFDWAAESGANVALSDGMENFVYVEYNSGSPRVIATTSVRTDHNTNILLAEIFRDGTDLRIHEPIKVNINAHAGHMHQRLIETLPFARASGAGLAETGTRNFSVAAATWWEGLTTFTTAAFDSDPGGAADTFVYFYDDGAGGHTEVTAQDQIDNLQYDDGSGTLATLGNARFGVHWIFLSSDNNVCVLYGLDSYTLTNAQDADVPGDQPVGFSVGTRLIGKIIIGKSDSTFTAIESVFDTSFETAAPTDHEGLTGLLGGAAANHFHLRSTEADVAKTKDIIFTFTDPTTSLATGNNKAFIIVNDELAGMDIISVQADVDTAPAGAVATFQLNNVTSGQDILSTEITIDDGETSSSTAATPPVIDTAQDDLTLGDKIRLDIDTVGSTAAKGLFVTIRCRLP